MVGRRNKTKGGIILCLRVASVKTNYEKEMVANNEIKYYRVVRKWMKTKYKYYLKFPLQENQPTNIVKFQQAESV